MRGQARKRVTLIFRPTKTRTWDHAKLGARTDAPDAKSAVRTCRIALFARSCGTTPPSRYSVTASGSTLTVIVAFTSCAIPTTMRYVPRRLIGSRDRYGDGRP